MSQVQKQEQDTDEEEICGAPTTTGGECTNKKSSCPWHDEEGNRLENNAGRPTKLTDETEKEMIEAAEEGLPMKSIARAGGIAPNTLYEWMDKYDEFSTKLKQARTEAEQKLAKEAAKKDPRYILTRSFNWDKPSADTVINNNMQQTQAQNQEQSLEDRLREAYEELEEEQEAENSA